MEISVSDVQKTFKNNTMKKLIVAFLFGLMIFSCKEKAEEIESNINTVPKESIFLLDSKWQNQNGKELQLKDLKGKNLVVVMIFTSCQTACPILVADMQKIASKIDPKKSGETNMVLISIDPENDTPEVLKKYAQERKMDDEHWTLLTSDKESIRELANVLAVKYKKISPIIFSHSNIITVFNKNGEMVHQAEGTVNSAEVAKFVNELK